MMRVAINAQFVPGTGYGGVESVLIGLVRALAELDDQEAEYVIIGPAEDPDWLTPQLGSRMKCVAGPPRDPSAPPAGLKNRVQAGLRRAGRLLNGPTPRSKWPEVPVSNGFYEQLGCDVIHFPYQSFTLCALPSVYNPHDLQHRHFPQYYHPEQIARRETIYYGGCRLSHTVAVASSWVADDITHQYGISREKIQVIPWAPPTAAYARPKPEHLQTAKDKYALADDSFAFYPAMLWPHKNHHRLISAVARLRDQHNLKVNLICTAKKNHLWEDIHRQIHALDLQDQVRFLGLIPAEDLRALYALAQFVIIPTLFEAASGPLFEAWMEGTPAACSAVTSLPEQAQDAALLFDPYDEDSIAAAMARMSTESDLRANLRQHGRRRLKDFSWQRTAKAYRALYRRAAKIPLTAEDQQLLRWDWMQTAQQKSEILE